MENVIRTEIDLTSPMSLENFILSVERIKYAFDQKEFESEVFIESGDLSDEVHRLVFIVKIKGE